RGLHRRHEHLTALGVEQDPPQLLDVSPDEVEQRPSGLRLDVAFQGRDGCLAVRDQVGDDRWIGLECGWRAAKQGRWGALVSERLDEAVALDARLQSVQ